MKVAFGYEVGPEDNPYAKNALNVFVKGKFSLNNSFENIITVTQSNKNTSKTKPICFYIFTFRHLKKLPHQSIHGGYDGF